MCRMYGVTINDINIAERYGLIMTSHTISAPQVQTNFVNVPGRNGAIDLSEVVSSVPKFNDRTITIILYSGHPVEEWELITTDLQNEFSGKRCQIIFDDDLSYFWNGRITSVSRKVVNNHLEFTITATVGPYKYSITKTSDNWEWDNLDFEQDAINDFYSITLSGEQTVTVAGIKKPINPTVTVFSGTNISVNGIPVKKGVTVLYDIVLTETNNTLTLNGSGRIAIDCNGGRL